MTGCGLPTLRTTNCQQVVIFRMLAHKTLDELAFDRELAPLRTHGIERRACELRADALAAEGQRHFGVDQRDRARRFPVGDEGDRSADVEFKPAAGLVVAEIVGHAKSPTS